MGPCPPTAPRRLLARERAESVRLSLCQRQASLKPSRTLDQALVFRYLSDIDLTVQVVVTAPVPFSPRWFSSAPELEVQIAAPAWLGHQRAQSQELINSADGSVTTGMSDSTSTLSVLARDVGQGAGQTAVAPKIRSASPRSVACGASMKVGASPKPRQVGGGGERSAPARHLCTAGSTCSSRPGGQPGLLWGKFPPAPYHEPSSRMVQGSRQRRGFPETGLLLKSRENLPRAPTKRKRDSPLTRRGLLMEGGQVPLVGARGQGPRQESVQLDFMPVFRRSMHT